jgi:hypothetical protein
MILQAPFIEIITSHAALLLSLSSRHVIAIQVLSGPFSVKPLQENPYKPMAFLCDLAGRDRVKGLGRDLKDLFMEMVDGRSPLPMVFLLGKTLLIMDGYAMKTVLGKHARNGNRSQGIEPVRILYNLGLQGLGFEGTGKAMDGNAVGNPLGLIRRKSGGFEDGSCHFGSFQSMAGAIAPLFFGPSNIVEQCSSFHDFFIGSNLTDDPHGHSVDPNHMVPAMPPLIRVKPFNSCRGKLGCNA